VRPYQVFSMMNNVPSVRTSEVVDTVQPRRRVWRLDSETEVDLGPPTKPKSVVSRGDQGRNCGSVDRSVEGNDAPTEFDLVKRGNSTGWRSVTPELPVGLLWRPLKF